MKYIKAFCGACLLYWRSRKVVHGHKNRIGLCKLYIGSMIQ